MHSSELIESCFEPIAQNSKTLRVHCIALQRVPHMSLVLLIMLRYLSFSLLVVLHLQFPLPRPVLSQIFIQLRYIIIH